MKLNVAAFGLTCAIVWAVSLPLLAWWFILLEGPDATVGLLGRMYPGYAATAVGSLVGILWGFADGLAGGLIFAWLYNTLAERLAAQPEPAEAA